MRNINRIQLLFLLFFLKITFLSAQNLNCAGTPLYGYGKLYYNNTQHSKEEIYPLTSQNKYNPPGVLRSAEKKSMLSDYNYSYITVRIKGFSSEEENGIRIVVENKTKETIIIAKKNLAYNDEIFNSIFYITSKCILFDYIGQIVNFGGEYQYPDDFIIIKPYGNYHAKINLGKYYRFLPGVNEYDITIPNIPFHFLLVNGNSKEFITSSNKIQLTIKGPINKK